MRRASTVCETLRGLVLTRAARGRKKAARARAQEFAGDDNRALYTEETEAEAARKRQLELANAMAIPGMIRPQDRPDYNMAD